ncbi:MAG: cytochrome c family protein [Sphingomonadaceae bacterium]|nr:cytochrome c family protein [Sphingomonadaceae bacterium]
MNNSNTIFGWILGSGIVALGLSIVSAMYFGADKPHAPHEGGFPVEVADSGEGAASGPSLAELLATGDATAGEKVFAKCTACHTINQGGANGIGPNLFGVMGKPIGSHVAGFAYSGALSGHGGDWTFENMNAWLSSPRAFADGTKMSFAGLSKPEDRANIMLYLLANGGGPALPTPEAAPAEGEADAAPEGAEAAGEVAAAEAEQEAGAEIAEATE